MTVSDGDFIRTTANFTLADGSLLENVYHHMKDGGGFVTDAVAIGFIEDWVELAYSEVALHVRDNVVSALSSIDEVNWVVDKWEIVRNIGVYTPVISPNQQNTALPNQSSCFVTYKTERPKSIGRKFLFPFTIADVVAGIVQGALVTALVAFADVTVNDIDLGLNGEFVPGIPRTAEDTFLPFTLGVVTNVTGSQRRRRPGSGA